MKSKINSNQPKEINRKSKRWKYRNNQSKISFGMQQQRWHEKQHHKYIGREIFPLRRNQKIKWSYRQKEIENERKEGNRNDIGWRPHIGVEEATATKWRNNQKSASFSYIGVNTSRNQKRKKSSKISKRRAEEKEEGPSWRRSLRRNVPHHGRLRENRSWKSVISISHGGRR